MLIGIIYVYLQTSALSPEAEHSFSIRAFYTTLLKPSQQDWLFWLFFAAFAIKMPIFPLHTWQPDTYEQAPYSTVMVLSGIMVKMGVFAMIRWLLPVFPLATARFDHIVMTFCVIGIIYAGCIAFRQNDLKRFVAWSSIAHIGLMCASLFAETQSGMQGVMIQMFNHGVNIIGLWIVIELIERQFGTRKISQLGGLAQRSPAMGSKN